VPLLWREEEEVAGGWVESTAALEPFPAAPAPAPGCESTEGFVNEGFVNEGFVDECIEGGWLADCAPLAAAAALVEVDDPAPLPPLSPPHLPPPPTRVLPNAALLPRPSNIRSTWPAIRS
jgi:hypothetical protein